MMIKEVKLKK